MRETLLDLTERVELQNCSLERIGILESFPITAQCLRQIVPRLPRLRVATIADKSDHSDKRVKRQITLTLRISSPDCHEVHYSDFLERVDLGTYRMGCGAELRNVNHSIIANVQIAFAEQFGTSGQEFIGHVTPIAIPEAAPVTIAS